jgi:predicted RNase H-like HicB family nuclease
MRYMAIIEHGNRSWGAHVPDLPGCVAVGASRDEVVSLIREAIRLHIEDLRRQGLPIPRPTAEGVFVDVEAA